MALSGARPLSASPLALYQSMSLLIDLLEAEFAGLTLGGGGPPTGPAGGELAGTYPNPTVADNVIDSANIINGSIVDADVNAANKDGAAGTPSMRTLGTGATQSAAGNDSRFPPTADGNSAHYLGGDGAYALASGATHPGTSTIGKDRYVIQYRRLQLLGSERLTLQDVGELLLLELGAYAPTTIIAGTPKTPTLPFTVPTEYFLDQMYRLSLVGAQRATLQGTADLILNDDFATRDRIVLAGRF